MLVYYSKEDDTLLYTMKIKEELAPEGDYVVIPDDVDLTPLAAYRRDGASIIEFDLEPFRKLGVDKISDLSDKVRSKFITSITGQDMIYNAKEREAVDYLSQSPEPTSLEDYPFIEQEVGSTGSTPYEVAQVFANLSAYWRIVGSQLEGLRISAITDIQAATSKSEIEQAVTSFAQAIEAY